MKSLALLPLLAFFPSCQPVKPSDQATFSRPAFDFAATGPRSMECKLSGQFETARASASNISAGGCSSCR